jgi:hypothetical protein
MSMLAPTIGLLPKSALLPSYALINLAVLTALIGHLARWFHSRTGQPLRVSLVVVAALCLLWPPVQYALQHGQAAMLSVWCALLAVQRIRQAPVAAGLLFTAALIKPSMALLFFFIPLVRWEWKPIWTAFMTGLLLTLLPALWLGEWPWVMLSQWMELCRYVLQGAFTLQEVLNAIGWENTHQGLGVVLALWSGLLAWCAIHRRAGWEELFAFLCLGNLAWTYHERHDFVLLVFPLVLFAAQLFSPRSRSRALIGLALCAVLGLALSNPFYVPATLWARTIRWAGRLALPGLWIVAALAVRVSHGENSSGTVPAPAR